MQNSVHPIFPASPVPLYAQLADLLRQRVLRRLWEPGTKVPSLEALVAEFQVARVTVRQAIDILEHYRHRSVDCVIRHQIIIGII